MKNSTHIFITDSDYSCNNKSFSYLLGFQPSLGSMVLDNNILYIILDPRYFNKTKNISLKNIRNIIGNNELEIQLIESREFVEEISKILKNKNNISAEGNIASIYIKEIEANIGQNIEINKSLFFEQKRIIKTDSEKNHFKKAIDIIDNTLLYIQELNKKGDLIGKTELEIRSIILDQIFKNGGIAESFDSIVAFGENSAIPHHTTGQTIIGEGVLLIDMGALYNGYCSDFTRTFWVGRQSGNKYEEFIKIYNIVKKAHNNAYEKTSENMTGKEIHSLTNEVIKSYGYEKEFCHGTGHGVGLDIHEQPMINKKSDEIIKNDMFFTIEPGIYLEGNFGIRLEDIVYMENGKLKKYTKVEL